MNEDVNPDRKVTLVAKRNGASLTWELSVELAEVVARELEETGWTVEVRPAEPPGPA